MKSRNVLISFLGTGPYHECEYFYDNDSVKSKFIQMALIELFCKDFTEEDLMCFFLTEKANDANWENGLRGQIQACGLSAEVIAKVIPVGKSEDEIWDIFNALYNVLNENDTVILDITHGFRSLPMLGFVILNYAHYLKNVTVKDIFYGAYEARDTLTNRAPVFQLTQFYNLTQWASAADAFVNYGTSDKLQSIVRDTATFFLGSKGTANAITKATKSMLTLRGTDIVDGNIFSSCMDKIDKLETSGVSQTAFKPIMHKVKEKLNVFKKNDPLNFLHAVKWYLNHRMIPQALTMMQEGLLTYIMEKKNIDYHNKKFREHAGAYLNSLANMRWKNIPFDFTEEQEQLYKEWSLTPEDFYFENASYFYNDVRNLRNDVNHGGFNKGATSYDTIISKAEKHFETLEELCQMFSAS